MGTQVRSFAKVNLGLRIGPVRADGYHELVTLYQTIGLHDLVSVTARRAGRTAIRLRANDARVPVDARNTVWGMVERALEAAGVTAEVEVEIDKRLPVQGGLGAGSANAAAALLGLERELGVQAGAAGWLSGAERLRLAGEVGSDVPLFLVGGTVLGYGRGELLAALPDVCGGEGLPCVVAVPGVGVSTPAAFRRWDEQTRELTAGAMTARLGKLSRAYAFCFAEQAMRASSGISAVSGPSFGLKGYPKDGGDREDKQADRATETVRLLVHAGIENDFEDLAFSFHPSLRAIEQELAGDASRGEAVYAALSGSGSALFGLYGSEAGATAAQQRVQGLGDTALQTRTVTREGYWRTVFVEEKANGATAERLD